VLHPTTISKTCREAMSAFDMLKKIRDKKTLNSICSMFDCNIVQGVLSLGKPQKMSQI